MHAIVLIFSFLGSLETQEFCQENPKKVDSDKVLVLA
jgi:hypothetical protein